MQRLKYHQSNIKREIIIKENKNNDNMIVMLIDDHFTHHKAMPVKEVKGKLQELYNHPICGNGTRMAKATDLKKWYEVKGHTKTIDGKSVACMTIIRPKFVRESKIDDMPF